MAIADLRKAAVLVMSLPKGQAAKLLGQLMPDEAAALSGQMARLRQPAEGEQAEVFREFAAKIGTTSFQFLHGLGAEGLLGLLAEERPQTIALIFCHLPARQAAEAIDLLAPECQAAVLSHIAAMGRPRPEIVRDVAVGLRRRFAAARRMPRGGLFGVVKMLNSIKPAVERKLLGEIAQADPDLFGEIRRAMFGDDVAACTEWDTVEAA